MPWIIRRTDTFLESFRRVRDNSKVVLELARKIKRLQADPLHVGGWLSGSLYFKKINTDCKTVPVDLYSR
jgi:hypothetical protein